MEQSHLSKLQTEFVEGKIKSRDLEQTVFEEICRSKPEMINEACQTAARIRCEAIEKHTGVSLDLVKGGQINTCSMAAGKILPGIEMKVGAALIPMGIAGPIRINGEYVKEEDVYVPLATNEAALVAGLQRGIKAINLAGGLGVMVHYDGMARAPMLEAPNIYEARRFCRQIKTDTLLLEELSETVRDPFLRLEYIEPYQLGTKVFLRMNFKTGDAMGMNGVTKASADIARAILAKLSDWRLVTISSNLCTDKKASHINVLNGRGKSVETEIIIPEDVLGEVFRKGVTSKKVERVVFHKCYLGSSLAGTVSGFNVNAANAIAAFFAASGQDLAQVITSASCFVQAEAIEEGLHFMLSLPCLEVAAVGGGSQFGTAKEVLRLMGCDKAGTSVDDNDSVMRLAEIAAAAVTALDLNTACAQAAEYEMADSHVRLARGESG